NGTDISNAFPFSALPVDSGLPRITEITPDGGPEGQYLTVRGVNFGNTQGQLLLDGINGDFTFPPICSSSFWQDTQIIVKVPTGVSIGIDRVARVTTSDGIDSNDYLIDITAGLPGPGLCYLHPDNGPAGGVVVDLAGDNFGTLGAASDVFDFNLNSWGTGSSWANNDIEGVAVPGLAESGSVMVVNDSSPTPSNSMMFNVGSCGGSNAYCQAYGLGDECCSDNTCAPAGGCSSLNTCTYTWTLNTEADPFGLAYSHDCSNNLQSPSPWPDDMDGYDSEDAYLSTNIVALFTRDVVDADLLIPANFMVTECNVGGAFSAATCTTAVPGASSIINSGSNREGIVFDPTAANLNPDTWYRIVMGAGPGFNTEVGGDTWPTVANPAPDWHFKTRPTADMCPVSGVTISPQSPSGDTNIGQTRSFYASPQADNCNMCGENYNWDWAITAEPATAPPYASISPTTNLMTSRGLTGLTGLNATENETPNHVTLEASTMIDTVTYTGATNPIINAVDLEIIDYDPNCNGACSNPMVVVEFNSPIPLASITTNEPDFHIRDSGGTEWRTNVTQLSPNSIEIEHGIVPFNFNDTYTVTVPGALQNIYSESLGADFVWVFTTGEEECSIEDVSINPDNETIVATAPGDIVPYSALPMANNSSCGWYPVSCPAGTCDYAWSESDASVALINNINNQTTNAVTTLIVGDDFTNIGLQLTDNSGGAPEVFADTGVLDVSIIGSSDIFTFTDFTPNCGAACLTSAVTITFNNQPNATTLAAVIGSFSIEDSSGTEYIDVGNPLTGIAAGFGLMLNHIPLLVNETYTVTVPAGFEDNFGNTFAGHSWTFGTSDIDCPITGADVTPDSHTADTIGQVEEYDIMPMSNSACGLVPVQCPVGMCTYNWTSLQVPVADVFGPADQMSVDIRNQLLTGTGLAPIVGTITDNTTGVPVNHAETAIFDVDMSASSLTDPYIISYEPLMFGTDICPNTAITIHFSEIMDGESINNNIKIYEGPSTDTSCFFDGASYWCEVPGSWVLRKIDSDNNGVFETEAIFNPSDYFGFNQTVSVSMVAPNILSVHGRPLDLSASPITFPNLFGADGWMFDTGDHICQISFVEIDPPSDVFNCSGSDCIDDELTGVAGNQHVYDALVYDARGDMLSGTFLTFDWDIGGSSLVGIGPDAQQTYLTANPINGNLVLALNVTSTDAGSGSDSAIIELFMCENPWPSLAGYPWTQGAHNFSTYYCYDTGVDGDTPLPYLAYPPTMINFNPPEYLGEYLFLINVYADSGADRFGSLAFEDNTQTNTKSLTDKIASWLTPNFVFAQTTNYPGSMPEAFPPAIMPGFSPLPPTGLTATPSEVDVTLNWNDSGPREEAFWVYRRPDGAPSYSFRANLPANTETWVDTGVTAGQTYNYQVYAARNCIFPCVGPPNYAYVGFAGPVAVTPGAPPDTVDLISVRMLSNFGHSSIRDWYNKKFDYPADQGTLKEVDGYEALEVGATTYVAATNYNGGAIYTNIYLVAHNVGASDDTKEIYNQLLENFEFNQNSGLDLGTNICNGTGAACSSDFDCPDVGDYCESLGKKMRRDARRLGELMSVKEKILEYGEDNMACSNDPSIDNCAETGVCPGGGSCVPYYPLLTSGSFVDGMSTSKWPLSWQGELSSDLGTSLPVDPVNLFNGCVSADADPDTCWDESTLTFGCTEYSQIYLYENTVGGIDFEIGANFETETPGSFVFVGGVPYRYDLVLYNGPANPTGMDRAGESTENIIARLLPQCDGFSTYSPGTPTSAYCGNGIIDPGEACDRDVRTMGCSNPPAPMSPVNPVGATWWDEQAIGCNPSGTIEGGVLVECQWTEPTPPFTPAECGGYCGDTFVQPFDEVCESCSASGVCEGVQYICAAGNGTATCDSGIGRSCVPVCNDMTPAAACGDNIWTEGIEQCDGSASPDGLSGWDCTADAPAHGEVVCTSSCTVVCSPGTPYLGSCGNGIVEPVGEQCDYVGYTVPSPDVSGPTNTYGCTTECQFTDDYCGDGVFDYAFDELCDTDYVTPPREYTGQFEQYQCRMSGIHQDFATGNDYGRCTATDGGWCGDGIIQDGSGLTTDYGEICDIGDSFFLPLPLEPSPLYPITPVSSSDIDSQYECRYDCAGTTGGYCGDGTFQEDYEGCDYHNFLSPTPYESGVFWQLGRIYQYDCDDSGGSMCTGLGGWCGDGITQDGSGGTTDYGEICDSGSNNGVYSITSPGYCGIDCQSSGPYCGDTIVQAYHGEACDGEIACRLHDPSQYVAGTVTCINDCQDLYEGACCTENRLYAKFMADNSFTLYVNGTTVGTGTNWEQCDDYGQPLAEATGDGACEFLIDDTTFPGVFNYYNPNGNVVAFEATDGGSAAGIVGSFSCQAMRCQSVCYMGSHAGETCTSSVPDCTVDMAHDPGYCIHPGGNGEGNICMNNDECKDYTSTELTFDEGDTDDWEHKPSLCIPESYGITTNVGSPYWDCTTTAPSETVANDWREVTYNPGADTPTWNSPDLPITLGWADGWWNSDTDSYWGNGTPAWGHMVPGAMPIWEGSLGNNTIYCRHIITGI
ncbi:hypothetical protein HN859_02000, partial [Candidatus Parcubacteria bacterium]|nr:hypothetical protein [Candidatus Parcubacteria bacterium]